MAKVPLAGNVKTRLQPFLAPEQCAEFAECLLRDAIKKTGSLQCPMMIAYTPPEKRGFLDEFTDQNTILLEQIGEDLGERMFNAFQFALRQKFEAVVMTGTDSPTFPAAFIEQAFECLETNADVVLGKTTDGGFYLIGLRNTVKQKIFENVAWSSDKTFEQFCKNIKNSDLRLREVPLWYDIDEQRDLRQLEEEFLHNENAKRRAPRTFGWIKNNL